MSVRQSSLLLNSNGDVVKTIHKAEALALDYELVSISGQEYYFVTSN